MIDNLDTMEFVLQEYELKLQDILPRDEFIAFVKSVAKSAFLREVCELPDSSLRDFCIEHFDLITADDIADYLGGCENDDA